MTKTRKLRQALKNISKVYQCDQCKKVYDDRGKAVQCAKKHIK